MTGREAAHEAAWDAGRVAGWVAGLGRPCAGPAEATAVAYTAAGPPPGTANRPGVTMLPILPRRRQSIPASCRRLANRTVASKTLAWFTSTAGAISTSCESSAGLRRRRSSRRF